MTYKDMDNYKLLHIIFDNFEYRMKQDWSAVTFYNATNEQLALMYKDIKRVDNLKIKLEQLLWDEFHK